YDSGEGSKLRVAGEVDGSKQRWFGGGGHVSGCRRSMVDGGSTVGRRWVDDVDVENLPWKLVQLEG
ncbi:hypothetical protein A2U01_0084621, partial [Trifolium medium]|nr:hypothetical protein [Trifolium medium]